MKLSEFIAQAQELLEKEGDGEIYCYEYHRKHCFRVSQMLHSPRTNIECLQGLKYVII